MNEIKEKKEPKTLLSVMLDMAKAEIGDHVLTCMRSNNIPPDLIILAVKGILLDLNEMKVEQLQRELWDVQKILKGMEEDAEHD